MAVNYVDIDSDFPQSGDVQAAAQSLKCSENELLGVVTRLYCWLGRQIPHEGSEAIQGMQHLAEICCWSGDALELADALHRLRVITLQEDGLISLDGGSICWGAERSDLCRSSEENDFNPEPVDVFGPTVEAIREAHKRRVKSQKRSEK